MVMQIKLVVVVVVAEACIVNNLVRITQLSRLNADTHAHSVTRKKARVTS